MRLIPKLEVARMPERSATLYRLMCPSLYAITERTGSPKHPHRGVRRQLAEELVRAVARRFGLQVGEIRPFHRIKKTTRRSTP
jgi:hypothetical protein